MKVFMFPGQGSQYKGMGGDLFDGFKDLADKADGILGYSLRELCIDDPRGELNQTRFTQPALYVVNALSYFRKLEEGSGKPDFLAGHSLGEFNALMAAGCYDFETGLKLVQKRGELMGEVSNGAMAAIVNAGKEEIESALAENGLSNVFIANYNTPRKSSSPARLTRSPGPSSCSNAARCVITRSIPAAPSIPASCCRRRRRSLNS
ncbi:acyltransferase domain-containing protein [Chromobacterium vaccinii]|uniref:acyltransferase domain-containing protein n=1 Tax=Chromobacterium vaccinii TaxID=1108595 RepID=UPI000E16B45D|nr:acyltransferase domain-containing protein [Chromobacterium vaccinii]SUX55274.1 Polyketide biosynthesis malonyl CoA-acyl carrier protein transacylase pksC [Chromobacterium vaccinii]